jgi:hypothetical protein
MKHESRVLWVDAICINQCDTIEKATQVSMMADIYRRAEVVQVWLGPETDSTTAGMRVLSFLAGSEDILLDPHSEPWPSLIFCRKTITGLMTILEHPWFERGWVVQEAVLAMEVTLNIGSQKLSWDKASSLKFLKRIKFAEITPLWRDVIQVDMRNLREILALGLRSEYIQESCDLLDAIHEMRHRKTAMIQDSIYSVLSLASDSQDFTSNFPVDCGLSVEQTFENLYRHIQCRYGIVSNGSRDVTYDMVSWRRLFTKQAV